MVSKTGPGPAKAALESVTRYLAPELGPKGISVNALSHRHYAASDVGALNTRES